nr:unnamed protein product [Digitaria exilis]
MEGIGGMLAAGAIKLAAGKLAEAAGARFMLQWRFSDDLEAMKTTTEFIEAVLKDAETQSLTNNTVQVWLQHLTKASYDISDMFDEFELDATKKSALRKPLVL